MKNCSCSTPIWTSPDPPLHFQLIDNLSVQQIENLYAQPLPNLSSSEEHILLQFKHLNRERAQKRDIEKEKQKQIDKTLQDLQRIYSHPICAILETMRATKLDTILNEIENEIDMKIRKKRIFWTGLWNFRLLCISLGLREEDKKPGPIPVFNLFEQLMICLIWLRRGYTFSALSNLTGQGRKRTTDICSAFLRRYRGWTLSGLALPSIEELRARQSPEFNESFPNHIAFFVDGTVIPTFGSSIPTVRKMYWNPKHKKYAKTFTILVSQDGGIVTVTEPLPGKIHDRDAWNLSTICEQLALKYSSNFLDQNRPILAICGDKGYPDIDVPAGWRLILTKSAKNSDPLDEGINPALDLAAIQEAPLRLKMVRWGAIGPTSQTHRHRPGLSGAILDARIARFRAQVEITFGTLKEWEILSNRFYNTDQNVSLSNSIEFICALFNFNKYVH